MANAILLASQTPLIILLTGAGTRLVFLALQVATISLQSDSKRLDGGVRTRRRLNIRVWPECMHKALSDISMKRCHRYHDRFKVSRIFLVSALPIRRYILFAVSGYHLYCPILCYLYVEVTVGVPHDPQRLTAIQLPPHPSQMHDVLTNAWITKERSHSTFRKASD